MWNPQRTRARSQRAQSGSGNLQTSASFSATMSECAEEHPLKDRLQKLRCHFTWGLLIEDTGLPDLEDRILEEIQFLDTEHKVGIYNLLAYVKHLQGKHEDALENLKEAEEVVQGDQADHSDVRSLVTWGNYAWVYYHMGRLADAQTYLDKVENTCQKSADPSRYRMECPEMDCEEGWALLKCGRKNYERAKACFEKALEADPENPEFNTGYAITVYRLDYSSRTPNDNRKVCSLQPLRKAVRLNPQDAYLKALLALKLQDVGQEAEGRECLEEALAQQSSQTYVFRYAAKFFRRQGHIYKDLKYLKMALEATPTSAFLHHQLGLCYRAQMRKVRRQDRENVDRLIQLAIGEFQETLKLKPTFELAHVNLAEMYVEKEQYREAEEHFQEALRIEDIDDHIQQEIHYRFGQFYELRGRSEEDKAITQYLKGLKIEKVSHAREKLLKALEILSKRRVNQNVRDVESTALLGLIHKLRGEVSEALLCYEKALRLAADLNSMF
ncbi:interferon-induced protein with tetratricopeptide repeats 1B [Oryctolagus cuniculus]|uniref:interferon-induced protein with tetratricopeptide repeats 1B n=1 Tax=Oryctolagus cuniculus TaxID=9986 RepID=UPI00387A6DDB